MKRYNKPQDVMHVELFNSYIELLDLYEETIDVINFKNNISNYDYLTLIINKNLEDFEYYNDIGWETYNESKNYATMIKSIKNMQEDD